MQRRTKTVYVETDRLFSPRGKVLHGFEHFFEGLAQAQMPCMWLTGWTRAQMDEPRRRLGQSHPYIGENGCGVYLPEDYFHLKGSKTIRLGRYTCIPIAKPQPAAAEALEGLASDMDVGVVPLRTLSARELSQNTGLPAKEAELVRMRDFDELFFFAGAGETDVERFGSEAKRRGLAVQKAGVFWSLSCGANLGRCVRELGGLYDRALRSHALRIGVQVATPGEEDEERHNRWPAGAFDRTLLVEQRVEREHDDYGDAHNAFEVDREAPARELIEDVADEMRDLDRESELAKKDKKNQVSCQRFYLHAPDVWSDLLSAIAGAEAKSDSI